MQSLILTNKDKRTAKHEEVGEVEGKRNAKKAFSRGEVGRVEGEARQRGIGDQDQGVKRKEENPASTPALIRVRVEPKSLPLCCYPCKDYHQEVLWLRRN